MQCEIPMSITPWSWTCKGRTTLIDVWMMGIPTPILYTLASEFYSLWDFLWCSNDLESALDKMVNGGIAWHYKKAIEDRKHEQQSEEQRKKETHREKKQQHELWPNNKHPGQVQFKKQQNQQTLLQGFIRSRTYEHQDVWWIAAVLERTKHQSFPRFNHFTTPRKLREEIQ